MHIFCSQRLWTVQTSSLRYTLRSVISHLVVPFLLSLPPQSPSLSIHLIYRRSFLVRPSAALPPWLLPTTPSFFLWAEKPPRFLFSFLNTMFPAQRQCSEHRSYCLIPVIKTTDFPLSWAKARLLLTTLPAHGGMLQPDTGMPGGEVWGWSILTEKEYPILILSIVVYLWWITEWFYINVIFLLYSDVL